MRVWLKRACLALAVTAVASSAAFAQDLGKIASDILHKSMPGDKGNLSKGDVTLGLKEALNVASGLASKRLGAKDGFMADVAVRILCRACWAARRRSCSHSGWQGRLMTCSSRSTARRRRLCRRQASWWWMR